ncbi:MAG: nuclear transport factor 2 family protein [Rubrivivax sp.]|nr:MAG: nuclear transport factor 2 family protein [Rubrivivax sp.]
MKRRALLLAGAGASAAPATPATRAAPAAPPPALLTRLKAMSDAWDAAIVAKDRAAIEAPLADDFRQIDARGNVETKASFVEGVLDPELQLDPYDVEEFEVRLYGDTALLSGRTRMTGHYRGTPFDVRQRYIDVYVKQGRLWRLVSVQVSPLTA